MELIRVVNARLNKVKFVTKEVAEDSAPRYGYYVEDDNYEVVNGKIIKRTVKGEILTESDINEPDYSILINDISNTKPLTKSDIFAKYLPNYIDDGKIHWKEAVKAIELATKEEAEIIIEGETRKSVIEAFKNK